LFTLVGTASPAAVLQPRLSLRLQDAKARFSEVVREALEHGPKHITLHSKAAVVILSAEAYGRLAPVAPGRECVMGDLYRPPGRPGISAELHYR